jgi:hypothetical protein
VTEREETGVGDDVIFKNDAALNLGEEPGDGGAHTRTAPEVHFVKVGVNVRGPIDSSNQVTALLHGGAVPRVIVSRSINGYEYAANANLAESIKDA